MPNGTDRTGLPAAVTVTAAIVVLAALRAAQSLVVPVLISLLVTLLAAPLVHLLRRRGWPPWLALGTVLAGTLAVIAAGFLSVSFGLSSFVADLPLYTDGAARLIDHLLALASSVGVDLSAIVRSAEVAAASLESAETGARSFLASIAGWTVVLGVTGAMLAESVDFHRKATRLLPPVFVHRLEEFTERLSALMGVLTTVALITAVGDAGLLLLLGIPSALLWAGLAFVFSYVPVVGFLVVVVPPSIATLLRFGPGRALLVLVGMIAVDRTAAMLGRGLLRRRVEITPFWSLFSVVFWGWLLGPAGAILAVPLTLFIKFALESSERTEPFGRMMAPLQPDTS